MNQTITNHQNWLRGSITTAIPIVFGYLPIGFAFGVLAKSAGISGQNAVFMSLFVFAGSSQLIAVGLFAAGTSSLSIIATTFIVNLRHFLMAAALAPYLNLWKKRQLAAFAFELTDETFAVHSTRFEQSPAHPASTLTINIISQAAWITGTLLGVAASEIITDVRPLGIDYALAAMFIALLAFQIKDRILLIAAIFGGIISTTMMIGGLNQWNVVIATILAATLGLGIDLWTKKLSS